MRLDQQRTRTLSVIMHGIYVIIDRFVLIKYCFLAWCAC